MIIRDEFDEWFSNSIPVLMRHARRLAPKGIEADDLLQEVLLRMLENLQYYRTGNFLGWGYTILYHYSLNLYRSMLHRDIVPENLIKDEGYDSTTDVRYDIVKAIDMLRPRYKCVVKLFLEGYSYEEIAAKQQISIGTVKSRMSRAREQLRKILKDYTSR